MHGLRCFKSHNGGSNLNSFSLYYLTSRFGKSWHYRQRGDRVQKSIFLPKSITKTRDPILGRNASNIANVIKLFASIFIASKYY